MPSTSRFYLTANAGEGVKDLVDLVADSDLILRHGSMDLDSGPERILQWFAEDTSNLLLVFPVMEGIVTISRQGQVFWNFHIDITRPKTIIVLPKPESFGVTEPIINLGFQSTVLVSPVYYYFY